jgi:mannose-6-phosphate isomerase-like protein (cupin superfamily)
MTAKAGAATDGEDGNMSTERHMVPKPWGGYTVLKKNHGLWIKKLFIKKGERISLQSHELRTEVWVVISGEIEAQVGNARHVAGPDDVIVVGPHRKHRIAGITDACVMELAQGIVREHDIVRYEDDYGRT